MKGECLRSLGSRVTAVTALAGFWQLYVCTSYIYISVSQFELNTVSSHHPHHHHHLLLILILHCLTVCFCRCICSFTARLTHSVPPTPNGLPFPSFRHHQRPLRLPAAYLLCSHSISDLYLHLSSRVTWGGSVRRTFTCCPVTRDALTASDLWPNSARRAPPPPRNRLRTNVSYRNFLR
jgi:hypothetical protein